MGDDKKKKMTKAAPLYSQQHLMDFDWGTVTTAWLLKFPDPDLKQVSSIETVGREMCEAQKTMRMRRLFLCTFPIPWLLETIFGKKAQVVCVEEAHWDVGRRRLTVHGHNESLKSIVSVHEVCCFTEVEPGKTLYTQSATVRYRTGVLGNMIMPAVNELFAGICQKNAHKGITAMTERTRREAARCRGEELAAAVAEPSRPAIDNTWSYRLPALGIVALGCWFALRPSGPWQYQRDSD